MKRSWEFSEVESAYLRIEHDAYGEALDEWAKLVYEFLCQLENEIKLEAFQNLTAGPDGPCDQSEEADVA